MHTPLITGSDCEGAGEMFHVTTMDLENVPKNPDGTVDYSQDFFGKETSLTVSGQLNGRNLRAGIPQAFIHLVLHSGLRIPILQDMRQSSG